MKVGENMGYIFWAAAVLLFSFIEIFVPMLITIWFALAATFTLILSLFIQNKYIEISVFIFLSIIFLVFTRKFVKKFIDRDKSYSADMIGDNVVVIKKTSENMYDVKYKGAIWTAVSEEGFNDGEVATIEKFNGNKIILKK